MEKEIDIKYFPTWDRYLQEFREMELTKFQLGWLWFAMMEYQFENKAPETVPKALKMAWTYLRKDLDDARRHYQTSVKNGRKGGRPKKKEPENNPEETEENLEKGTSSSSSTSTTTTTSMSTSTSTDPGSAPASAGVCCDKNSFGEFGWVKLTNQQYDKLMNQWGYDELHRCITYVDEAAQSTGNRNRWKDWYLMVRRCHENRWYETKRINSKPEIPKGASGVLGEAELEAIQRVLRG